jgi:hypothetical protein
MTDTQVHLTEEERHAIADGSLPAEHAVLAEAHLRACDACADDVARIRILMTRARDASIVAPPAALDELWPSIRTRIEASKVVPFAPNAVRLEGRRRARRVGSSIMMAAALVVAVTLVVRSNRNGRGSTAARGDTSSLIAVADSAHAYEAEAQTLLNQLELRRSMLRPEAVAAIDHDLRIVDSAIAELKGAIAHDPTNAALRRLLASSYRQKIDLLKRAGNAG